MIGYVEALYHERLEHIVQDHNEDHRMTNSFSLVRQHAGVFARTAGFALVVAISGASSHFYCSQPTTTESLALVDDGMGMSPGAYHHWLTQTTDKVALDDGMGMSPGAYHHWLTQSATQVVAQDDMGISPEAYHHWDLAV